MKWNKITLEIREEVEDIVISTLADIGLEGAEIQDKQPLSEQDKKQMFVDILPDMPEDDGVAYLNFYLDEDEDVNAMLEKVKAELQTDENVDTSEVVVTYQIDSTDLSNYKRINEYVSGRKNPFASTGTQSTTGGTTDTSNSGNTSSAGSSNSNSGTSSSGTSSASGNTSNSSSSSSGYLPDKGTK